MFKSSTAEVTLDREEMKDNLEAYLEGLDTWVKVWMGVQKWHRQQMSRGDSTSCTLFRERHGVHAHANQRTAPEGGLRWKRGGGAFL